MSIILMALSGWLMGQSAEAKPIDIASLFPVDAYPADAMRRHEEGRVAFTVSIGADGHPTQCQVTTSSVSSSLDQGTCAIMMTKARFVPAHDEDGKPIASRWSGSTRWQIEGQPPIDLTAGPHVAPSFSIIVSVDPEGRATACRTQSTMPGKSVGPDPCSSFPIGRTIVGPLLKDGKPVSGTVTFTSTQTVAAAG